MAAAAAGLGEPQEVPPTELARQHWHRARAATVAGRVTWRNGTSAHAAPRLSTPAQGPGSAAR